MNTEPAHEAASPASQPGLLYNTSAQTGFNRVESQDKFSGTKPDVLLFSLKLNQNNFQHMYFIIYFNIKTTLVIIRFEMIRLSGSALGTSLLRALCHFHF